MTTLPTPVDESLVRFQNAPDSAITLIEFGDFACPLCRQAAPAIHAMLSQFAGRLRFGYWQFPVREARPQAELAAEAAEAAGAQGRFWEFSDLFVQRPRTLDEETLAELAKSLALDVDTFQRDLSSHRYLSRVQQSVQAAKGLGVRSTPTFLLDGTLVDATFGLDHLRNAVRQALGASDR
jgi:protein-disulfide isomerase